MPGKRKSRRPPPGADTALGLALYFEQLVEDKGQLWPTNRGALASAFAAWRRKGWTAEQIRAMIDAFARRDALIKTSGRAAWRVFLARAEEFRREVEYVSAPVRNDPSVRWV